MRARVLEVFHEAVAAGARRGKAAAELRLSLRTIQRWEREEGREDRRRGPRTAPANKLSEQEREQILQIANSPRYRDLSPKQIVPLLADRGQYVGSESSFYRVLHAANCVRHRERARPPRRRPRALSAEGPNRLWSWDITYLPTAVRGRFLHLYVVVDVWSRLIVGWTLEHEENSQHASTLIQRCALSQGVERGQVTLHSDNGSPMKGQTMLSMLGWLGIAPSFSHANAFSSSI